MKKRRTSGNSILRIVFVVISLLLQVGWLLLLIMRLNHYSTYISLFTGIMALLVVLRLYSQQTNSAIKTPWIMLILVFPVMGLSLYLLVELGSILPVSRKRLTQIRKKLILPQDRTTITRLQQEDPLISNQFQYLMTHGQYPVCDGTAAEYYAEAADAFEAMKEAIQGAKSFIFMEYFIIDDGEAFQQLHALLRQKAAEGVEIRLMYDDFGSIGYLNLRYARKLRSDCIRCQVFNPALPVLNLFMNHRDHRKITVIDGKVGFTGGYNLADEYFGITKPYGHWKDTGLRLEGPAVRNLTAQFLELWSLSTGEGPDPAPYLKPVDPIPGAAGFILPFGDNPLSRERIAENVYLNLISQARTSVYFMTPYLIITDELCRALGLAAKRGVDVRIVTPGIPDKRIIYSVTRSYYHALAAQGVRIFEYSPGFCHAKMCICDGKTATVGTSNLDYRSLYLHFEDNVLLHNCNAVTQIAADFDGTFPQCREVTEQYRAGRSAMMRMGQCILRLFAPLL